MVWKKIKDIVYKNYFKLQLLTAKSDTVKQKIEKAVFEVWNELDNNFIKTFVRSMLQHIDAVLEAKGEYIKY